MDNKKITVICGISGSGKSTYAKKYIAANPNTFYVNADSARAQFTGDINNQDKNYQVFLFLEQVVEYVCREHRLDVIIDCTNVSVKSRKVWLQLGKNYGYDVCAAIMTATPEECAKRNAARTRVVPQFVLDRQYASLLLPSKEEGFDKIEYID